MVRTLVQVNCSSLLAQRRAGAALRGRRPNEKNYSALAQRSACALGARGGFRVNCRSLNIQRQQHAKTQTTEAARPAKAAQMQQQPQKPQKLQKANKRKRSNKQQHAKHILKASWPCVMALPRKPPPLRRVFASIRFLPGPYQCACRIGICHVSFIELARCCFARFALSGSRSFEFRLSVSPSDRCYRALAILSVGRKGSIGDDPLLGSLKKKVLCAPYPQHACPKAGSRLVAAGHNRAPSKMADSPKKNRTQSFRVA